MRKAFASVGDMFMTDAESEENVARRHRDVCNSNTVKAALSVQWEVSTQND